MAYLLKLANYTGIDLETAYVNKMKVNQERIWSAQSGLENEGGATRID
jgi:hypothetical protein